MLDLVAWERSLQNHRLISAVSYGQMVTPGTLNNGSKTTYGFGLAIGELGGRRKIGHGGGINGFQTELDYFPDDSLTVVVLVNTEGSNPSRIADRLARAALGLVAPAVKDLPLGEHTFVASFDENVRLVFDVTGATAAAFTLYQGGMAQRAARVAGP